MRICVDPGHGGRDSGAVVGQHREKDLVLRYSERLAGRLAAGGHVVLLTRVNDNFVELSERAKLANDWSADCLISMHANAASAAAANGAWVIYDDRTKPQAGMALAREVFAAMAAVPGIGDADPEAEVYPDGTAWVGHRQLTVLSKAAAPAILVELGFMTNPADMGQLLEDATMDAVCEAIADGVESWGYSRGLHQHQPPEVDVEEGHAPLIPTPIPYLTPLQAWTTPVSQLAEPGETLGSLVRRQLPGLGAVVGGVAGRVWGVVLDRVMARVEQEVARRL